MGLDTVELLMCIEEAFGLTIPDRDAEKIRTMGQAYRYIIDRVNGEMVRCPSAVTFYQLRRSLVGELGVNREQVKPSASVADLVPREARRKAWSRLRAAMGRRLPRLRRPAPLGEGISWFGFAAALVALFVVPFRWHALPPEAGVALIVAFGVSAQILALWLTRPFAVELAPDCLTVRGLVGSIVGVPRAQSVPIGTMWNRETVWETLQTVVSEVAGVDRELLNEETDFFYDLD